MDEKNQSGNMCINMSDTYIGYIDILLREYRMSDCIFNCYLRWSKPPFMCDYS